MKTRTMTEILKAISDGHDTLYRMEKQKITSRTLFYLKAMVEAGLLEKTTRGRERPYNLTEKGENFLKMFKN